MKTKQNNQTNNANKEALKHIFTVSHYGYEIANHIGYSFGVTLTFNGKGISTIPDEPAASEVYAVFEHDIPTKMAEYDLDKKTITINYPMSFLEGVLELLNNSSSIRIQYYYPDPNNKKPYADIHGDTKFKYPIVD